MIGLPLLVTALLAVQAPNSGAVSLDYEYFKAKVQPVFDRFVKLLNDGGDDGKKILAEVEALEAKYSK